jgi:hypothetical protein
MKHKILYVGLALILLLSACGAASDDPTAAVADDLTESYTDALPVVEQLALGSLLLEDTEQAIDEGQAATLLPLWQAYRTLSTSDKAAEAEVNAIVKQLQGAMTSDQIDAIAAMKLTADDFTASAEELGGLFGRGARQAGDSEDGEPVPFGPGGGVGARPEGGLPGGMPGMGGGFGAGAQQGELDRDAQATRLADLESEDGELAADFRNRALITALIRTLQIKMGEQVEMPVGAGRLNQAFWEPIATATGISAETLQAALADGGALAEAITANGGDLDAVRAALREAHADSGASQEEVDAWIENLLANPMPQFGLPAAAETATPEP